MENPRPRRPPESLDHPEGEAAPSPPMGGRSPRQGVRALLLGAAGVLLLGGTGFALATQDFFRPPRPKPDPECFLPRKPNGLSAAKNHIREGRYTEARASLLELQAQEPNYPGLQDYLTVVEKEVPNQAHLKAAQAALAEQKLATVKAELDQVTPDTMMFEQVNSLQRSLRDAADTRTREASTLINAGQREAALPLLQDVLAVFPEHRDARILQEEALSPARPTQVPPPVGATQLLGELRAQAKDRYLRGYTLKETDPRKASAEFRQVLALTQPDDELHQKAQAWLGKLSARN